MITTMIYQTENLTLDTSVYRLLRDDKQVDIEPQVFDLLVYLIENRDRVVTRNELLETLWKGRVVSDSALSARLKAARKAIGDSGTTQGIIKTVHGRGYQYIADVRELSVSEVKSKNEASSTSQSPLSLDEKPSIAVLPFTNMSGDATQEYFSDGLTEDIITQLSRFRDLFVIASYSSFTYKGKTAKIQDVSQDLGVRYVLEGSVQKSNDRVRISVQLIDGYTGQHLWAERYDRELSDIFKLQDEVTERIVGTLASGYGGQLRKAWQKQAHGRRPQDARAFDYFMRGLDAVDTFTKEGIALGRKFFEEAIELDPHYARAYGKLSWTYILDAIEGWEDDYETSMSKGLELATTGIKCDNSESWAHWPLAAYYMFTGKYDLAISEFDKAVELNPNDADVLTDFGWCLSYFGKAEEGLESVRKAMHLNPYYPEWYVMELGQIYHDARQYEKSVATFESLKNVDTPLSNLYLAASYAALGFEDEAHKAIERVLVLDPQASLEKWTNVKMAPYRHLKDREHFRENLRKAGLPD